MARSGAKDNVSFEISPRHNIKEKEAERSGDVVPTPEHLIMAGRTTGFFVCWKVKNRWSLSGLPGSRGGPQEGAPNRVGVTLF